MIMAKSGKGYKISSSSKIAREIVGKIIESGEICKMIAKVSFCNGNWTSNEYDWNEDTERRNDFLQEIYLMLILYCDKNPQRIIDMHCRGELPKYISGIVYCQYTGSKNFYATRYKNKWFNRRISLDIDNLKIGGASWDEIHED